MNFYAGLYSMSVTLKTTVFNELNKEKGNKIFWKTILDI